MSDPLHLTIRFFVPGAPRGKQRARVVAGGAHSYTPKETVERERQIAWEGKKAMAGRPLFEGPVMLTVSAAYVHPASWSAKKKAATYWKTTKPDIDNIVKLVKDALNRVAWQDDAQVAVVRQRKHYTKNFDDEGLTISIQPLVDRF